MKLKLIKTSRPLHELPLPVTVLLEALHLWNESLMLHIIIWVI